MYTLPASMVVVEPTVTSLPGAPIISCLPSVVVDMLCPIKSPTLPEILTVVTKSQYVFASISSVPELIATSNVTVLPANV